MVISTLKTMPIGRVFPSFQRSIETAIRRRSLALPAGRFTSVEGEGTAKEGAHGGTMGHPCSLLVAQFCEPFLFDSEVVRELV
jgi:hypothetical protein